MAWWRRRRRRHSVRVRLQINGKDLLDIGTTELECLVAYSGGRWNLGTWIPVHLREGDRLEFIVEEYRS